MKGRVSRPLLLGTAIDHSSLDTVEQNRTSNQIKLSFRFQVLETIVINQIKPWFTYDLPKHQGFMWKNYWSHFIWSFLCDLIFNIIRCSKSAICKFVVRKKTVRQSKQKMTFLVFVSNMDHFKALHRNYSTFAKSYVFCISTRSHSLCLSSWVSKAACCGLRNLRWVNVPLWNQLYFLHLDSRWSQCADSYLIFTAGPPFNGSYVACMFMSPLLVSLVRKLLIALFYWMLFVN